VPVRPGVCLRSPVIGSKGSIKEYFWLLCTANQLRFITNFFTMLPSTSTYVRSKILLSLHFGLRPLAWNPGTRNAIGRSDNKAKDLRLRNNPLIIHRKNYTGIALLLNLSKLFTFCMFRCRQHGYQSEWKGR
jgi:hypothetical protein